jgi:hypothetical protein
VVGEIRLSTISEEGPELTSSEAAMGKKKTRVTRMKFLKLFLAYFF